MVAIPQTKESEPNKPVGIILLQDPKFEMTPAEFEQVNMLIKQIQIDFQQWIGDSIYDRRKCLVFYGDEHPRIIPSESEDIGNVILIHAKGYDYCRWIYQFAHEYCHHLIDGPLTGELRGLLWFEETICELASYAHLTVATRLAYLSKNYNTEPNQLQSFLGVNLGVPKTDLHQYLQQNLPKLQGNEYQRGIYSDIAVTMLPLFQRNTSLWKILLHMGDMREWDDLTQLFDHLEAQADATYLHSLKELRNLLLGS